MSEWTDFLADKDAKRCLLIDAKVYSGAAETTRYISTHPFITASGDTPASTFYEARVRSDMTFITEMSEIFGGKTSVSWGGIDFENSDGGLDDWIEDSWDGRDVTLKLGRPDWALSQFGTILEGKIDRLAVSSEDTLTLFIRDRQQELDIPIQSGLLTSGEREGEPKPLCIGKVRNGEPVQINATYLIYQVHDGPIEEIEKVYDGGDLLQYGTSDLDGAINDTQTTITLTSTLDFGTVGILEIDGEWITYTGKSGNDLTGCTRGYGGTTAAAHGDATPVQGSDVIYLPDIGEFVLGGSPVYGITFDAKGAKTGGSYISEPGEILRYIVSDIGPLADPGDLDTTALTALDTSAPYDIGVYVRDRQNMLDVLDEVAKSVGAWYGFDRDGDFTCGILTAPGGTPDYDIEEADIYGDIEIEVQDPPRWRSRLGYQRHWLTQNRSQLASSVTDARAAELEEEYRTASDEDTSVQTAHLNADEPDREDTLIDISSDADSEVQRRQTLLGVQRYIYTAECYFTPFELELGQVVTLTDSRYNLSSTKFRVIGMEEQPITGRVKVTLWK